MASIAAPELTPAAASPVISAEDTALYRLSCGAPYVQWERAKADTGTMLPSELRTNQLSISFGNIRSAGSPWM